MSVVKTIALIFALINYKNLPLCFHIRFWALITRYLYLGTAKPKSVYEEGTYRTFTPFLEMDFNLHKSNSTYFSDSDLSRTVLMAKVFRPFYRSYQEPDLKLAKHQFIYSPLGSTNMVFRHEILPYKMYNVTSKVFGWNEKWLYVSTKFERNGKIHAHGLSKYVFKLKRKTISPETAIKYSGLLTPEAQAKNEQVKKYVNDALELEQIEHLL